MARLERLCTVRASSQAEIGSLLSYLLTGSDGCVILHNA
jgi:hypothetical protein